jgi:hypothetical protein
MQIYKIYIDGGCIVTLFFVLLTPGLLCQITGSGRGIPEFHSMRTSGVAIFVHTARTRVRARRSSRSRL